MIAPLGPKICISHTELLTDEMVLWQEHNQLIVSDPAKQESYLGLRYAINWNTNSPREIQGVLSLDNSRFGAWDARVQGDRVEMSFSVTNNGDCAWPVAEAFMCYKHKGAKNFWDPHSSSETASLCLSGTAWSKCTAKTRSGPKTIFI